MTVENIKSFREYLEEQKNIENTILEDENGSEKPETPQDKKTEKSTSLADRYYTGSRFTTTPEGETNNDKIKDLEHKSRILMSTLKEMMAMFIGNNDIKTTDRYDVENIRALKMLSTSLNDINDSLDVDNSFKERTDKYNEKEEKYKNETQLTRKGKRDELRKDNDSEEDVKSEEVENSDDLLNERLFGFRVARNDWINAKSKYNADRTADKLAKENKLFDNEKRETFLAKTMKDYEKRASVVINKSANEIMRLIDNADKDIKRWINNRRYVASEDTYIQKISFNLNKAFGLIRYIASSLNTILSDYRNVIYRVSSKMSDAEKKQEERDNSHNTQVKKNQAERFDRFIDKAAETGRAAVGKTVEASKAAAGKLTQARELVSKNIKDALSAKEKKDAEEILKGKSEEELEAIKNAAQKELEAIKKAKGKIPQTPGQEKVDPPTDLSKENRAAVKFAKEFEEDEDEDEPTNIFDYALKKAKQNN